MKIMDGITKPDMTITQLEFEQNDSLARVINGKIFLGKTENEKKKEKNNLRIVEIDKELEDIDMLSARSSRAVAFAYATDTSLSSEDISKVKEYETKSIPLREERSKLVKENEKL